MLTVTYLQFPGDTTRNQRSGWYICDASGAVVMGTPRFEQHASAVRAASKLVNTPVLA